MAARTRSYGYPKMGPNRELKRLVEKYWKGGVSKDELVQEANKINIQRINTQKDAGVDQITSFDFAMYDQMLNHSLMFGVIPERFSSLSDPIDIYFGMARGTQDAVACEMTKWFDTNYHYIVPEITGQFTLSENLPLKDYQLIKDATGVETVPNLIGPFTYISLSKVHDNTSAALSEHTVKGDESAQFKSLVLELSKVYNTVLKELAAAGVKSVQIDEPALVLDQSSDKIDVLIEAYGILTEGVDLSITVQTYYEELSHFARVTKELPVAGIGLDFVCNDANLKALKANGFPADKTLVAGVISGRDIWKTDYKAATDLLKTIGETVDCERVVIANAAPLSHLPHTIEDEREKLTADLLSLLAFANERLQELGDIKAIVSGDKALTDQGLDTIRQKFKDQAVLDRAGKISESNIGRNTPFATRIQAQNNELNLPLFPTTTIGSFPQTQELREKRKQYRAGELSEADYENYINTSMQELVKLQEDIGLDVLVHGEFERTDMVEFFGEKMSGFAFSKNGWVQSYGTRCVKPPIIYGDVSRPEAMTVKEVAYAQELTERPVKGMLTGPVTILNWSFYRKDISKKAIAYQIGLALLDEVLDLEKANIKVIQIDEPAFREGLPLKKDKQANYLAWAVNAFKLSHDEVRDETQIHTHMCYSEFNEIIDSISAMDADVISIEASRSRGDIIEAFEKFNYDKGVGLGVYDIHSPRVPSREEILEIANRSLKVIDKSLIWINPDCGLKTRAYEETVKALENMVTSTKMLREAVTSEVV